MLCPISCKSKSPGHVSSTGCIAIMVLVLFFSSACKGQDATSPPASPRVAGGNHAERGRFSYMCSIRERGSGGHVCGSFLIDENWIMTAAHCLDPDYPDSAGMSLFLYCNIHEREDQDSSKRFTTIRCYLHHLWDGTVRNGNDIALCQLAQSATVAIPDISNIGDDFSKNDVFSVLGWGRTSKRGDLADVLQIGSSLRFLLRSTCNETDEWAGRIKESMMCVGGRSSDTCRGDSGGPLFIPHDPPTRDKDEEPALDLIVGITSFGAPDCEANVPGVYTRISCYRAWVDCIMQGTDRDCSIHSPCGDESPSCSSASTSTTFNETDALERIRTAISSDEAETVKEILCEGLSPNAVYGRFNDSLLISAAQNDAIESAKILLQQGADIEYENSYGQAALSRAAQYGSVRAAQFLLDNEANIETKSDLGWTPLINAARYNSLQVVELLLEKGANIESKSTQGWTPLHHAAADNSIEAAKELIARGANVNSKDDWQWTPLHVAVRWNSVEVVKTLIANGSSVNSRERYEWTPLHYAARENLVVVAKELIAASASVDSRSDQGSTPLHIAARANSLGIAKELIASDAVVNNKDDLEWTPLHLAAQDDSLEVAKELITNGADTQSETNVGDSPLHIAAYHGSLRVVQYLLDAKVVVDSTNDGGSTPLHHGSSRGHTSVVRNLLRNGATKTKTDDDGKTPFDVICTNEFLDEPCENDVITTLQELLGA